MAGELVEEGNSIEQGTRVFGLGWPPIQGLFAQRQFDHQRTAERCGTLKQALDCFNALLMNNVVEDTQA